MKIKKVFYATTNPGKINEVKMFFSFYQIEVLTPQDIRLSDKDEVVVKETEGDYKANALLKAEAWLPYCPRDCALIADDTGLEVEALGGKPGVRTSRFAGENCSPEENRALLLEKMKGVSNRTALFRCVLCCYVSPKEEPIIVEGTLKGKIAEEERGEGGFGYDPVFCINGNALTLAVVKEKEDFETHRIRALRKLVEILKVRGLL